MDLVDFKSMIVTYRVAHDDMPIDIMSRFRTVRTTHQHNTRQENNFIHRFCRTTLKSKCLSVKGPVLWNNLPVQLKESNYKTVLVGKYA